MGFFSQDCDWCSHPALSIMATQPPDNVWMNDVVVLTPNGSLIRGSYDDYGRVELGHTSVEYAIGEGNQVFHALCWVAAGRPTEFTGESRNSADQGWFFDDDHNWSSPAEAKAHPPQAA